MKELARDLDSLASALEPSSVEQLTPLDAAALYAAARRRRRGRRALVVTAAGAACSFAVLAVAALPAVEDRFVVASQTGDVSAPEASASPETVVRTYLAAVDAHDAETVRELVAPGAWERLGSALSDWTDVRSAEVLGVSDPWQQGDGDMAVPGGWGMSSVRGVRVRLHVTTRRDIPLWPWDDVVERTPHEPFERTYYVVRNPESGRYVLFDSGKL